MSSIEARYQENGFQLVVYRERKAEADVHCPECQRPMHHVATIYDEWTESTSSIIHYYFCKREDLIVQHTLRTDTPHQKHTTIFEQPPHEVLVELLATARQQNGRNVTQLTINRRWWAPGRYPLGLGNQLAEEGDAPALGTMHIGLDEADDALPIPRYEPRSGHRPNPFTSRPPATPTTGPSADNTANGNAAEESVDPSSRNDTATPDNDIDSTT